MAAALCTFLREPIVSPRDMYGFVPAVRNYLVALYAVIPESQFFQLGGVVIHNLPQL